MHYLIIVFKDKILYHAFTVFVLLSVLLAAVGSACMAPYLPTTDTIKSCPLAALPKEILNHIASFLIFPDRETTEEFKTRLETVNHKIPCNTKEGKIEFTTRGLCLLQKKTIFFRQPSILIQKTYPTTFALSQDYNYYVNFNPLSKKIRRVNLTTKKEKSFSLRHSCGSKNAKIAVSNRGYLGCVFANKLYIYQNTQFTHVSEFKLNKKIIKLNFNKQSTKLAISTQTKLVLISMLNAPFKEIKSLHDYFFLHGICKNLALQLVLGTTYFPVFDIE